MNRDVCVRGGGTFFLGTLTVSACYLVLVMGEPWVLMQSMQTKLPTTEGPPFLTNICTIDG